VAVMKKGLLQQVDAPQVLYDRPLNIFVAGFIGSPAMNLLEARVSGSGDALVLELGSQRLTVPPSLLAERPAIRSYAGRRLVVGIRPEDMDDASLSTAEHVSTLGSTADLVEAMGSDILVHFTLDAPPVVTEDTKELARDAGDEVQVAPAGETVVVARFNPRSRVREGDPIKVAVDAGRLHLFDPDSGLSVWEDERAGATKGTP